VRNAALRSLIDGLVTDLIDVTRANVESAPVRTVDDVRRAGRPLVGTSPAIREGVATLADYLRRRLYGHHRIERTRDKARRILHALFERYRSNPRLLPDAAHRRGEGEALERIIADWIAGMTDRYAIEEYRRLYDPAVGA
jgi:dGTPase